MNSSILETIHLLLAPRSELSCSWFLWRRILSGLRERGHNRSRESGAFLLGRHLGKRACIVDFVLYDDLDPRCLDTGIVRFDGRNFAGLWRLCSSQDLEVIADVHVHPSDAFQSTSDRKYPMVAVPGHIALIVPRFATGYIPRSAIGIYKYRGAKRWNSVPAKGRRAFFHIGF